MKFLRLALLFLLLPTLAGCMGQTGTPLGIDRLRIVREQLEEIDRLSTEELDVRLRGLQEEVARYEDTRDRTLRAEASRKRLLMGYSWERRGSFTDANSVYGEIFGTEYGSIALLRVAQVAEHLAERYRVDSQDPQASPASRVEAAELLKIEEKRAIQALERAANFPPNSRTLLRSPAVAVEVPAVWEMVDIRYEASGRLDKYYRERLSYQVFEFLVGIMGGPERNTSYILAIVLIAILAKLITTPLSAAQFRSMQAMQRVQPELKKLQEKYKDDKQQLARAQMELFKEAGVNPFASCLPMLIQMPILIWVYYGIRRFVFRFQGIHFLYLENLADPDVISLPFADMLFPGPLLLLYGLSMYFSQKLIAAPAATPEQQQQQKMMAYMMPILLVVIMKGLPAAFILYWFLSNLLMTGHQYLIMRKQKTLGLVGDGGRAPDSAKPVKPSRPTAGPPPEAIEKLAQGNQRAKKKKRR